MKSLLAFWMGWSMGFVALSAEPLVCVVAAIGALLGLGAWLRINGREADQ